jgi:hypothetical protein
VHEPESESGAATQAEYSKIAMGRLKKVFSLEHRLRGVFRIDRSTNKPPRDLLAFRAISQNKLKRAPSGRLYPRGTGRFPGCACMAHEQLRAFLQRLRRVVNPDGSSDLSDAQLLERFVSRRDEAAFEVLVWRHGGLVLSVCGRLLRRAEDREDAFQATFLALARRAGAIGKGASLGSWL